MALPEISRWLNGKEEKDGKGWEGKGIFPTVVYALTPVFVALVLE